MEDFSQTLCLYVHFGGSFIDSFSSAKKRCNTSQGFGAFFGQSCDRDRFLFSFISEFLSFFLFLDFTAISDCVFNNKNNYVVGHTGYQIIITILVISSTPSLYANLRVPTRVYDVEGGAIFSKNSTFVFFDGAAWTPRLRSPSPIMAPEKIEKRRRFSRPRSLESLEFLEGQLVPVICLVFLSHWLLPMSKMVIENPSQSQTGWLPWPR